MVAIPHSPYEGTPTKLTGTHYESDLIEDSASDNLLLNVELQEAELQAEMIRLRGLEPAGFEVIPISEKIGRRGRTTLNATYFRSKNPTSPVPIGIKAGLGATDDIYWKLAMETANLGRDAYLMEPPRDQDLCDMLTWEHLSDVMLLQMQATHSLKKIIHAHPDVVDARGSDGPVAEVDLALHSMANNYGTRATLYDAQLGTDGAVETRSLIALMGAGLDGKQGTDQMVHHVKSLPRIFGHSVLKGFSRMRANNNDRDVVKAEAGHVKDVLRLAREAGHIILKPQVGEHIITLRGMGIRYAAIVGGQDEIFDVDDIVAHSGHVVDMMHIIEDADHIAPNTDPDFAHHLVAVSNILNNEQLRDIA